MGIGYSGDGIARHFIRRPVLSRALPAALVSNSSGYVFVVGQHFLNTTGLACKFGSVWGPSVKFINSSALNCTAPALDLPAGDVVPLSVSLNGEEVAGSLALIMGDLPNALQLDPQYAYYGD